MSGGGEDLYCYTEKDFSGDTKKKFPIVLTDFFVFEGKKKVKTKPKVDKMPE